MLEIFVLELIFDYKFGNLRIRPFSKKFSYIRFHAAKSYTAVVSYKYNYQINLNDKDVIRPIGRKSWAKNLEIMQLRARRTYAYYNEINVILLCHSQVWNINK